MISKHPALWSKLLLAGLLAVPAIPALGTAQTTRASAPALLLPATQPSLAGRPVEDVRVLGNSRVPTSVILNLVRTREGEAFDPATVEADYQRIYGLRRFANVEAKVEPTATGVVVVFVVHETRLIRSIGFRGNDNVDTSDLQEVVDVRVGEAIDAFRLSMAKRGIESLYRQRNYPFAHVEVPAEAMEQQGDVVFQITEGPRVRIRKIRFEGNSVPAGRLIDQVTSRSWIWIFRPGTFEPEQIEDDVAALRQYYIQKGYFDVRVGRKLTFSPDQSEVMITFVIEEGRRYIIDRVLFKGVQNLGEQKLRENLKLLEGQPYDGDLLQRDVKQIVKAYSPLGYIYDPQRRDPDYLGINPKPVFAQEPGHVELVYDIQEGKPFYMGRIFVKGNLKSQDKLALRELRVVPGQLYNSGELQDAIDRLRGTPYFANAVITPVGEDPDTRDVVVEVTEKPTASFRVGGGINSNGGVAGDITYEQRNFDIANWPDRPGDFFTERALTGAGQYFRVSLQPGTEQTNAFVSFGEPWLFDLPYSFNTEVYYTDRAREHWDETRLGGRVGFGKRFNNTWSALLSLRGEDVAISNIEDKNKLINGEPVRAPEILKEEGHSTLTSAGLQLRRDTVNRGPVPDRGTVTTAGWDHFGALGGDFDFDKLSLSWDGYLTLHEDLLERRTVLGLHLDSGYILGDAPFFERLYGGGFGSVRGFRFRGISPRSGHARDPIGGDFATTASLELSFPLIGDNFRGVIFTDAGTVERNVHLGVIRTSAGAGIRLILPMLGNVPFALDFAAPLNTAEEDQTQIISFSFGVMY